VALNAVDASAHVEPDTVFESLDESATRDDVEGALRTLARDNPIWAEVLRLHYLDGLRLDEVAVKLGRAHGTVRNDAFKARARLASIMRESRKRRRPSLCPGRRSGSLDRRRAGRRLGGRTELCPLRCADLAGLARIASRNGPIQIS
jgi:hypothetical protein